MPALQSLFPFLPTYSDQSRRWFTILFVSGLILWLVCFLIMIGGQFTGDENTYNSIASKIADYVTGDNATASDVARHVVGNGWFMPGVPLILTPLYVIFPNPDVHLVRLYATLLILVLWIFSLRSAQALVGQYLVFALLIFPSLSLTWHLFAGTIWGDLPSGILMVVALARAYRISCSIISNQQVAWKDFILLEITFVAMVYLRGSTFLIVFAVHFFFLSAYILSGAFKKNLLAVGQTIAGLMMFLALLAPWSITASNVLGGRVLTTSTVNLSLGLTFGQTENFCFGPCPEGNIWFKSAAFARQTAVEQGISELDVQKEMVRISLQSLTLGDYLKKVRRNFTSFLFSPDGFNNRFLQNSTVIQKSAIGVTKLIFRYGNNILYFVFFSLFIAANLYVTRRSTSDKIWSLLIKLMSLCVLIQPFLHPSHARYWVGFAPLMAASTLVLLPMLQQHRIFAKFESINLPSNDEILNWSSQALVIFQLLYAVAFGAVAVVLFFA